MYGPIQPASPSASTPQQLALACIAGNRDAGRRLIERLWETSPNLTITDVVRVVKADVTTEAFDALQDAFFDAHLHRYRERHAPDLPEGD